MKHEALLLACGLLLSAPVDAQVRTRTEEQKIFAPLGASEFGTAMDVFEGTLVVGAPEGNGGVGVALVYEFDEVALKWTELDRLFPLPNDDPIEFGRTVAIAGDLIVVGAPYERHDELNTAGAVYVFERIPGTTEWTRADRITLANSAVQDAFGNDVGISGSTVIATAPFKDFGTNNGAVYVFDRDPVTRTWSLSQQIRPTIVRSIDRFAEGLGVTAGRFAVSGQYKVTFDGGVWIYERDPLTGQWTEEAFLAPFKSGFYEPSLGLSGKRLAVGGLVNSRQAVRIYERNRGGPGNWGRAKTLFDPENGPTIARFGRPVQMAGEWLIAGAANTDTPYQSQAGAVYLFRRDLGGTNNWGLQYRYVLGSYIGINLFPSALALYKDALFASDAGINVFASGDVYVFQVPTPQLGSGPVAR